MTKLYFINLYYQYLLDPKNVIFFYKFMYIVLLLLQKKGGYHKFLFVLRELGST